MKSAQDVLAELKPAIKSAITELKHISLNVDNDQIAHAEIDFLANDDDQAFALGTELTVIIERYSHLAANRINNVSWFVDKNDQQSNYYTYRFDRPA